MERLAFGFYRALYNELESYETHFSQLQRDYARELKEETLLFAIDFSELYNYMHPFAEDAHRSVINKYILNTSNDQFSMLPGAVGELLANLEKILPKDIRTDFTKALLAYPAVVQFRNDFSEAIQNEEYLLYLYAKAESELKGALGGILDVLYGHHYTSVQALRNLFNEGKLIPIDGVQQIRDLSSEDKVLKLAQLVEKYLEVDRPDRPESNQIDAADFIVALLLNQRKAPSSKRYITIYSQATSLIRACRTHDNLRWENDYLIREAKYLQFRTKLQELFPASVENRSNYITEGYYLCQKLKTEISKLVDINDKLQKGAIESSLKLIDLYRKFDEEYKYPLSFRGEPGEQPISREQAKMLYKTLMDEDRFVGEVEDAYEVLKEHLRGIENTLQAFTPAPTNTNAQRYKTNLLRWLGLGSAEKKNSKQTRED